MPHNYAINFKEENKSQQEPQAMESYALMSSYI
jgi:hypothetical protein